MVWREREHDRGDGAAVGSGTEGEGGGVAVEGREPVACVGEADARDGAVGRDVGAGAVVGDGEHEPLGAVRVRLGARTDPDLPRASDQSAHTMLDGVLSQRLERQRRHQRAEHIGVDGLLDRQSVAEAGLLDREVVARQRQFIGERDLGPTVSVEHAPEQARQLGHHRLRPLGVALDERADRVERVEQEVGVELHPERRQPGFDQLALELRPLRFEFGRLGAEGGDSVSRLNARNA